MKKIICPKCGEQSDYGTRICKKCGNRLIYGKNDENLILWRRLLFGKDRTSEFSKKDIEDNKTNGIFACFGVLFFLPLALSPDSEYGKFRANQGLLMLILLIAAAIIISAANLIFGGLTGLLSFGGLVSLLLTVIIDIIWGVVVAIPTIITAYTLVISLISACKGQAREIPFIGFVSIMK